MQIEQKLTFQKVYKKLHANQKAGVNQAIKTIAENPKIGVQKKGDLSWVFVYKFKMLGQLMLLAYTIDEGCLILTLLALDSHENFYRDLKKRL